MPTLPTADPPHPSHPLPPRRIPRRPRSHLRAPSPPSAHSLSAATMPSHLAILCCHLCCHILPPLPSITRNVKWPPSPNPLQFSPRRHITTDTRLKNGKNGNVHRASQLCHSSRGYPACRGKARLAPIVAPRTWSLSPLRKRGQGVRTPRQPSNRSLTAHARRKYTAHNNWATAPRRTATPPRPPGWNRGRRPWPTY